MIKVSITLVCLVVVYQSPDLEVRKGSREFLSVNINSEKPVNSAP
mgnify:CR=1 FL=1